MKTSNSKIKLVTSNKFKLKEFKRFGLDLEIAEGLDLEEVDGTPLEVITYKAIDAGDRYMVEDTILIVDGVEMVDIRERINELDNLVGKKASWIVSIGCLIDNEVHTCSYEVEGFISDPMTNLNDCFGFDGVFYPSDSSAGGDSLHMLELKGKKDLFSARKFCIENFISKKGSYLKRNLKDIPVWSGKFQNISH